MKGIIGGIDMENFNGTKGKWKAQEFTDDDGWFWIQTNEADICKVNQYPEEMFDECMANLRLIEKAPELLSAIIHLTHNAGLMNYIGSKPNTLLKENYSKVIDLINEINTK